MKKQAWIGLAAAMFALGAAGFWGHQRWHRQNGSARDDVLAFIPAEASGVLFVDFDELRSAPFMAQVYRWAPQPQADPDYAQFLKETGFDFERDLHLLAVATIKHELNSVLFAIANGKFDRQKISAYAGTYGTIAKIDGRQIFSVPVTGSLKKFSFTFLRDDQIAMTDDANLAAFLSARKEDEDSRAWRTRFERLAGSPVFAVIRQGAGAGTALAAQAPGGLRSPQLSSLLDKLQWITIAGKPETDRIRVIAEGECSDESTTRQLVDTINGVVILAQAGLNDAKTRRQLDPSTREAYLDLLKSTDVSKIDRGETKSVRIVIEITPAFLDAASRPSLSAPQSAPGKSVPGKAPASKKGRT
jgi:hypothetical protein